MLLARAAQFLRLEHLKIRCREPERGQAPQIRIFNLQPLQLLAYNALIAVQHLKGHCLKSRTNRLLSLFRAAFQGVLPGKSNGLPHGIEAIDGQMLGPRVRHAFNDDFDIAIALDPGQLNAFFVV